MRGNSVRVLFILAITFVFSVSVFWISPPLARSESKPLSARPNFTRFVAVGDSLLAGFRDGGLYETAQATSMANLVALQGGASLVQPLIGEPGIPNRLRIVSAGPPPVILPVPGVSPGRTNIFVQNFNLAVPGHNIRDVLQTRPNVPIDSLTDLVLGFPGTFVLNQPPKSQLEIAEQLQPTFVLFWAGPNDVLGAALGADASRVTDLTQFTTDYISVLGRLKATGAEVVVANIPDVTSIPALFGWQEIQALTGTPFDIISGLLGLRKGDFVPVTQLALLSDILTGKRLGPLPANAILTIEENKTIRLAVKAMNKVIKRNAADLGISVMDANKLLATVKKDGFTLPNGTHLTAAFLGGIFSLDGIHPTFVGNAVTANAFIDTINAGRAAADQLPKINISTVAARDPLVRLIESGFDPSKNLTFESIDPEAIRSSVEVIIGKRR